MIAMTTPKSARSGLAAAILLLALALLVALAGASMAAEITIRPDLSDRVTGLKRLFPPRSPVGADLLRQRNPENFSELALKLESPYSPGPTVIRLEGPIEPSDADKLAAILQAPPDQYPELTYYVVLSLDSPGGNFGEAFRLSKVLLNDIEGNDPRIAGLIILSEDRCLSACAVLFADSRDRAHPTTDIRFVEKGAELGFHMPYFASGTDTEAVSGLEMLDLGYDVAAAMVGLLANEANPPELLQRTLRYRTPSDFYMLRGDLETWRMGFTPVAKGSDVTEIGAAGLDTSTVGHLCNLTLTAGPSKLATWEDDFCDFRLEPVGSQNGTGSPLLSELMNGGSRAFTATCEGFSCQVRVGESAEIGISVWRDNDGCREFKDAFPSQMCPASAVGVDTVSNHFLAEAYSCRDGELLPGTFSADNRPTIKRNVNLRDAPGREGRVVTSLTAGSQVEVTGCEVTADDQGVWYRIKRPGSDGWVSARFIGGHKERFANRWTRFGLDQGE